MASASASAVKAAYWPSWSKLRPDPADINTALFTHIYFAFLNPDLKTYKYPETAELMLEFITALRHKEPPVKTILSIGGVGADESADFARIASNPDERQEFINLAIDKARGFGFDGLDLYWEYPSNQDEMNNLGTLFAELRRAIQAEANATNRAPLLLTAAVSFSVDISTDPDVVRRYPVESMNQNLDWVNAMCYDYLGLDMYATKTGADAALYDPTGNNRSTSDGLRSWINANMSKNKLVMGMPLYGRTWQLGDPNSNGIGSGAVGTGKPEIMQFFQVVELNRANGSAEVKYDEKYGSTYSYHDTTWICYDDDVSVKAKVEFAHHTLGIRGYFFWALGGDNNCQISTQASTVWDQN